MSITIPINECTSFSVKKSAKDPPPLLLASKKKKYVVLGAFVSAGVGLVALSSAAQYSPSSGDGGGGGGGGDSGSIRASVIIDGALSSIYQPSGDGCDVRTGFGCDDTCSPASGTWNGSPASGTWNGKSFNGHGGTSFETCYKDGRTGAECWSRSYFVTSFFNIGEPFFECKPQGYTGNDNGWYFLNSGAASKTCGSPCQLF